MRDVAASVDELAQVLLGFPRVSSGGILVSIPPIPGFQVQAGMPPLAAGGSEKLCAQRVTISSTGLN